jgi:hypothetical protein
MANSSWYVAKNKISKAKSMQYPDYMNCVQEPCSNITVPTALIFKTACINDVVHHIVQINLFATLNGSCSNILKKIRYSHVVDPVA